MFESLAVHFQEGGFFMWFILAFFVCTVAFIAERTSALYLKYKPTDQGFRKAYLAHVIRGDFSAAENYATQNAGNTALGQLAALGARLRAAAAGHEEVQARLDEKLSQEITKLDRRTAFLAMFGNVATLLGLLGTIIGMIHSFSSVAAASPTDRATLLSKGISEAMNCTAFGLLTAIPALVAYAIFQNRTDRLVSELTERSTEIYHDLLYLADLETRAHPEAVMPAPVATSRGQNPRLPV